MEEGEGQFTPITFRWVILYMVELIKQLKPVCTHITMSDAGPTQPADVEPYHGGEVVSSEPGEETGGWHL